MRQASFTDEQYRRFISILDESIYQLRDMFPGRVVFGRVGAHASATDYHVWGANAMNWNLRDGQPICGGGMAAVMGVQKEGVFGIVRIVVSGTETVEPCPFAHQTRMFACWQVTTPMAGPPGAPSGSTQLPQAGGLLTGPLTTGRGDTSRDGDGASYDATSPKDFRAAQLKPKEQGGFCAAGALALRRGPGGDPELLLGMEPQGLKPLGGMRDHAHEQPLDVAVREFCEETGSKVKEQPLRKLFTTSPARRLYLAGRLGKYVLYVVRPKEGGHTFGSVAKGYNSIFFRPPGAEASYLTWISWDKLCAAVQQGGERPTIATTEEGFFRVKTHQRERISELLVKWVREPLVQQAVKAVLTGEMQTAGDLGASIRAELQKCDQLQQLSQQAWLKEKFGDEWTSKMAAPPPPPPAPITMLPPSDPEYQRLVAKLRPERQGAVKSIRQVSAAGVVPQVAYDKEKKALQAKRDLHRELRDVFHGTGAVWRSTAIALNGFDEKLFGMQGLAMGRGVYSVYGDTSTPDGYARGGGSILCMKGLVSSDAFSPGCGATTNPPAGSVLVWQHVKHIAPTHIIDFGEDSGEGGDSGATAAQAAAKAAKEAKEIAEQVKKSEREFSKQAYDDGKRAVSYYRTRLAEFQRKHSGLTGASADADHEELSKSFAREKAQFDAGLPVYASKEELLDTLQKHQVVIITAPTGSGKSTQLPQYMLDHVLKPDETRQVAVLQPRRVNASALCQRVAEERGVLAGREVGYTVGRGEELASTETRIRFMTHGLFVQLAKDPTRFARRQTSGGAAGAAGPSAAAAEESVGYAAVILDEAHERSADIDMSLALIKRLVAVTDVRVIVTSATIGSSKDLFRNFLREAPDKPLPGLVELTGKTFPVYVQRRDIASMTGAEPGSADASLHDKSEQLGFAGVGKVLCQMALQQAVELLQRSETDGNVLVFMPGEGDINRALTFCRSMFTSDARAASFGGQGTGFSFSLAVNTGGGRTRQISVGLYPFHGKLTSEERDKVLNPREDRIIVFTTNYAETGLTVDNVRYVIDTGLERHARFNRDTNTQELITQQITKSSMRQRTGRAGRVASGICVRLYSAEDEASFEDEPPPAIKEANVLQTVLRLANAQKPNPKSKQALPPLEMIEEMPEDAVDAAKQELRQLGLLSERNEGGQAVDEPTEVGHLNLKLGLGVRLGLFLYHCAFTSTPKPCLAAGVYLAAALSSTGHVNLLPLRPAQKPAAPTAPDGFEVETGSKRFRRIDDASVVDKLRQLLQDKEPVTYVIKDETYTAHLENDDIVQTNDETNNQRKIRALQAPAQAVSSWWWPFGGGGGAAAAGMSRPPFEDDSGDHWTLLRTVKDFVEEAQGKEYSWCQKHGLPHELLPVLGEAADTYEHITATLGKLGIDPTSDPYGWDDARTPPPLELKQALLTALCKAYFDQVAVPKKPQDLSHGLMWISENSQDQARGVRAFAAERGRQDDDDDVDAAASGSASPSIAVLASQRAQLKQQEAQADAQAEHAPEIRLDKNSALWQPALVLNATNNSQLVLFGSVIQTDGGKMKPSVQVASFIDPEMLESCAPDPSKMARVIRNSRRTTFKFSLGEKGHNAIKQDGNYAFFEKIRRKFPSVMINFKRVGQPPDDKEDKTSLVVTCPAAMEDAIKGRLARRLEQLGEEDIILPIPDEASGKIGNFIKVKQQLQGELSRELEESLGAAENDNKKLLEGKEGKGQWIKVEAWNAGNNNWDTNTKGSKGPYRVRICMVGRAKVLYGVIVGRVRAKLIETLGLEQQLQWSGSGDSMDMNMLDPQMPGAAAGGQPWKKRQMLLAGQAKPPTPKNVDEAILIIAHTAIWDAGGRVYGGFLRDWLIRGVRANDVDTLVDNVQQAAAIMKRELPRHGIQFQTEKQKGAAWTLVFQFQGAQLDMDLVSIVPPTPPGVDCDVGNFAFDKHGLRLKVDNSKLVSLSKAIKHCQSQKFVFYRQLPAASEERRLTKYMTERGWTCKSPIPEQIVQQLNLPRELLKPKQKYSKPWWTY